ncbi:hypothetical protein [Candidatus Poriferisodalis sp.]|uniref:hypothetical protein n=1 Tax=Candidatus Poriferisodalis sp. TaxID=3101277 RepID=UPI003B010ADC
MTRRVLLLAPLVFLAFACSDSGNAVTVHTEVPLERFEEVDVDDDGVVTRDALDPAGRDVDLAAEQAALEAEQAERAAQRAAQEAIARPVLEDPSAVAAEFPGGQLSVAQVRDGLADSPPPSVGDPENPTHEEFVFQLALMLQRRLAAVALDELGFPVDIDASDEDIDAQLQQHLEGPFEEFAQQRSVAEDPSIERLATPHCMSALMLPTEADADAAAERVRAGEPFGEVASEVNLPNLTEPDGAVACAPPLDLVFDSEMVLTLLELEPGDLTAPILLPSAASPTGELWVVLHLDELQHDQADLSVIGPFAGRVLTEIMVGYEVSVAPEIGIWDPSSLWVSMPFLP